MKVWAYNLIPWLQLVGGLATAVLTWKFFHVGKRYSGEWWAKTGIIIVSLVVSVSSVFQSFHMRSVLAAFVTSIGQLSTDVSHDELQFAQVRKEVIIVNARLADEEAALRSADLSLSAAQSQTSKLRKDTRALQVYSRETAMKAQLALKDARHISAAVEQAVAVANARIIIAQRIAEQAAMKAGVLHISPAVQHELEFTLREYGRGSASIACSSGLESVCDDLAGVCMRAGWRTTLHKGASFFTGAGFDAATPDPDESAGLYVWYAPGFHALASILARDLNASGFHAITKAGQTGHDELAFSVIFSG
jgi:hypothetical protein